MEKAQQEHSQCQMCKCPTWDSQIVQFDGKSHSICISCFKTYLEKKINEGCVFNLQCPHCQKRLTYSFIKKLLDPLVLQEFQSLILTKIIQADPLKRECPNPKCRISIILPKNFKRKAECSSCQAALCTECSREYHKGSCQSMVEKEIMSWDNRDELQICSFCHTLIVKNNGCDHMTCSVCGHQWCWLCGGYWDFHDTFNPFGCQILPFSSQSCSVIKKVVHYFILILAFIVILLIGAPIFLYKNKDDLPEWIQRHLSLVILSCCFAMILQPIFDVVLLFGFLPYMMIKIIPSRKQYKKTLQENLTQNRELNGLGITRAELNKFKKQS